MKSVIWDTAPHSIVDTEQHFRGSYCLQHQVIMLLFQAASTFETMVSFYKIAG
jgi:hypothetical protein